MLATLVSIIGAENIKIEEGGATGSYSIVLTSQPTEEVTVTLDVGKQSTAVDQDNPANAFLTFKPDVGSWDVPQKVLVSAVDDDVDEGTHTGIVSHFVTSADPQFDGTNVPNVDVEIKDNDAKEVPVNEPPSANAKKVPTPEDTPVTITLTGEDGDPEEDQTLTFALDTGPTHGTLGSIDPSTGEVIYTPDGNYNGPDSFTFTVTDDDTAGDPANLTSKPATVSIDVMPVIDLGPVDFTKLNDLVLPAGGPRYDLETTRDGLLTLEAAFAGSTDSIVLTLLDADGSPLAGSALVDGKHRIDWPVSVGERYSVTITGTNDDVDLTITNLLNQDGTTVTVHGTDGNDKFEFEPTGSYLVTINGVAYHFDDAEVDTVQFGGGPGNDEASLEDSSGNDIYTATPDHALMVAPDFTVRAESCSTVHAYARNGGMDTAIFIDSPGNDKVKAEDGDTVKMYSSNRSYYNRAKFFETVEVNFSEGGTKADARLWDSPASDTFDGMPGNCRFYSEDTAFDVTVLGADFVTVYSKNGGTDKLILHDSLGDDVFRGKAHKVEMFDRDSGGKVHKITARGFNDITAYADHGGQDIAKLYDSTLDDLWEAEYREGETWSKMTSTTRALYEAIAFEQVKGYSLNGGTNTLRKRITPPEIDFVLTHGVWEDAD